MTLVKDSFKSIIFTLLFSILVLTTGLSANAEIDPPKKQISRGVSAQDVLCREGLELVIRTDGSPACVRPETAERMHERDMLLARVESVKSESEVQVQSPAAEESLGLPTFAKAGKEIQTVPASSMSIVNFYITDHDLNRARGGIEVVPTEGLFEFTINGIPIEGPEKMIETGPNTGKFYVRLELPETIQGRQLSQDDIVLIRYLDESDSAGEQRVLVKSVPLTETFAEIQTLGSGGTRIGREFTVRLYEPDANRDSKDEDKIPLSALEFRSEGGIRTTLANPKFDANSGNLIETGPNTSTFEVQIKIPRQIDGKTIHIGDRYEIRYIDRSTPSDTDERIVFSGKIG